MDRSEPSEAAIAAAMKVLVVPWNGLETERDLVVVILRAAYAVDFPGPAAPNAPAGETTERQRIIEWLYRKADEHLGPGHLRGELIASLADELKSGFRPDQREGA